MARAAGILGDNRTSSAFQVSIERSARNGMSAQLCSRPDTGLVDVHFDTPAKTTNPGTDEVDEQNNAYLR
jgi:hypothetical protein